MSAQVTFFGNKNGKLRSYTLKVKHFDDQFGIWIERGLDGTEMALSQQQFFEVLDKFYTDEHSVE